MKLAIKVIRPGLLTTIQDLGRYGFQKYGVVVSGAMDVFALRIANLLVGNQENEGALEITLTGPTLQINEDCIIAITGANMTPMINEDRLPMWRPVYVKKGAIIRFGKCLEGCRSYLAVSGGFDIPKVMGSYATYLRGRFGGYEGRALAVGDNLKLKNPSKLAKSLYSNLHISNYHAFTVANWFIANHIIPDYRMNPNLRILRGEEFDYFTQASRERFLKANFRVTAQSDRMGYRLDGPTLELSKPMELISQAVSVGTIQVPPEGNPIILMADRQTTGGYPKIAQIASVDLPIIAQVKPGEIIQFQEITLEEAHQLYLDREMSIEKLKQAIALKAM